MKRRNIFLAVLAAALILSVSLCGAVAYFTTSISASGSVQIELGPNTDIVEPDISRWTKHVVVTNNDDSKQSVYVRVKAFAGSEYTLQYSGEGWTIDSEGFYRYSDPVAPGGQTENELLIKIDNIPENAADRGGFNVPVVYEATPVLYDEAGEPYADWNLKAEGGDL